MRKKPMVLLAVILGAAALALAQVYDLTNFHALGRMYQPAPDGHGVGKDNGPGRGTHHPGEDCGRCHRPGGRAEGYIWTMAGTLYADRPGKSVLANGEIILQDREGQVVSLTSNQAGNFWTTSPLASDPYTVATTHGHEPFIPLYTLDSNGNLVTAAPADDPSTWHYKTWVRKGNAVRPMMTIAGAGGSLTTPRMSCNMHHGGVAHRAGALWVGRVPTLEFYPTQHLGYRKHIYPILRSNCAPCHIPGKTVTPRNSRTDIETPSTAVDYSGGLDLMTYEGSEVQSPLYHPTIPYKVIAYETIRKKGVADVVDPGSPPKSLLLVKTVEGGMPHGGGTFWNQGHPDYRALSEWIREGARNN
jgi:hypothetical protein